MPRAIDPALLSRGGGLASQRSVEASAFVHPTQGLDGLVAHIADPSKAHMAAAIGLLDTAGYYAADEVEGALEELGGGLNGGSQNGVISGGTYASLGGNPITIQMNATKVRVGTERDLTGETIALTNNATNWVYVTPAGVLSVAVGANPPSITTPENVLLWRIVTDAAPAITSSTDARFFVRNLDRKVPITVRTSGGAAEDVASEACFITLDAALLYIDKFVTSGAQRKTRVIVRGQITIASSVLLPANNIIFEGEDGAEFITGGVLAPMFNLGARSDITFRNLVFTANHGTSTAIADTAGHSDRVTVDRCMFQDGGSTWATAVSFTNAASDNDGHIVRDTTMTVSVMGINIARSFRCLVDHVLVKGAASLAGATGIQISSGGASTGGTAVRHSVVNGFATGIAFGGSNGIIDGCYLLNSITGVQFTSGTNMTMTATVISLDTADGPGAAGGLKGVVVTALSTTISGCVILNNRAAWTATVSTPVGVDISANQVDAKVTGCYIAGFYNSVAVSGVGVQVGNGAHRAYVGATHILTTHQAIATTADDCYVDGCYLELMQTGVASSGNRTVVTGSAILLHATRGVIGIQLGGPDSKVQGSTISHLGTVASSIGVYVLGAATPALVDGCYITGFLHAAGPTGAGVVGSGTVGLKVLNTSFAGCLVGVSVDPGSMQTLIHGNNIACANNANSVGIQTKGVDGGGTRTIQVTVTDNTITQAQKAGILIDGYMQYLVVEGNLIDCGLPADFFNPTGKCIYFLAGGATDHTEQALVAGNHLMRGTYGVVANGANTDTNAHRFLTVTGNDIHHCGFSQVAGATVDSFTGRGSAGVGMEFVVEPVVRDNTISKVGLLINNLDVEGLPAVVGPSVRSKGVYLRNCYRFVVEGNSIINNITAGVAANVSACGVYAEIRSTGAGVPTTNTKAVIGRNTITWENGLTGDSYHNFGIYFEVASGSDGDQHTSANTRIDGNSVHLPDRAGIIVRADGGGKFINLSIAGNAVSNVNAGLLAPLTGYRQGGIVVQTYTNAGIDPYIDQVLIVGNMVSGAVSDAGIDVYTDTDSVLHGIQISDNHVVNTLTYGIDLIVGSNATAGTYGQSTISGNTVDTVTGGQGILVACDGSGTAAEVSFTQVTDNNLNNATYGVYVHSTNGFFTNVQVTGNVINNMSSGGIFVEANPVGAVGSSELIVSRNTVTAPSAVGIKIDLDTTNGSLNGVDVSGNLVEGFTTEGLAISSHDTRGLSVSHNNVRSGSSGVTGMLFEHYGDLLNSNWIGNNVRCTHGGVGETGFKVDAGAGGTQTYVTFTGNNVWVSGAPATTVVAAGGGWAPDYSICANNTSNGPAGAGQWGSAATAASFADAFGANTTTTGNQT